MNVLIEPLSGAIFFDKNNPGTSTKILTGDSIIFSYNNIGGITLYGESSGTDRFLTQGNNGNLLSVTDIVTGTLFTVNDRSSLPVLEVSDTDTVIAGTFNTNTVVISGTQIGIGTRNFQTNKISISGNVSLIGTLSANTIDVNRIIAISSVPVQGSFSQTSLYLSITVGTSSLYIPLYK